jgi:hypothetical protein
VLKAILASALCVALTACGMIPNRYGPKTLQPAMSGDNTGVILMSAGAKDKCITASIFLKMLPSDKGYYSGEIALPAVDAYPTPSDFTDHFGFVHTIRVPAGSYYFAPWLANPYATPVQVPRYDFSVAAGETVYLGEYYQSVSCSLSTRAEIRDNWERDRAVIARINPSIDLSKANTRLLTYSGNALPKK